MKKYSYTLSITAIALAIALPLTLSAHEVEGDEAHTHTNASANVSVSASTSGNLSVPAIIRAKAGNIQNNEMLRNKSLENLKGSTSTRAEKAAKEKKPEQERMLLKNSTSTREEHKEVRKEMHAEMFAARKSAVIKHLTVSLNNLKQIRDRISSRITKAEENGRNMTAAKSALLIADGKITAASQAITAIVSVQATASSSATTTIDLVKPRQVAEAAIKAIREAHASLVEVVKAIAHNMGLGSDVRATTTSSVSATTSATTTP